MWFELANETRTLLPVSDHPGWIPFCSLMVVVAPALRRFSHQLIHSETASTLAPSLPSFVHRSSPRWRRKDSNGMSW
jgi:hypothetical protein